MFPSYRNQSVDLQSKSNNWFLYDGNIGRSQVKHNINHRSMLLGFFFLVFNLLEFPPEWF